MKTGIQKFGVFIRVLLLILCFADGKTVFSQEGVSYPAKQIYKSASLGITQVSANAFIHETFLKTNDFGKVSCNGLIVRSGDEAAVFDTPGQDKDSEELITWIKEKLHCRVVAVIATHFHNDCLGGLKAFHDHAISSYANSRTIELAKENNFAVPQHGFKDSVNLPVGSVNVTARFFGEGHTKDNVVGYFPAEHIMFGGCLIKELDASKGFLGDANVGSWPATVEKVRAAYPVARLIIPGHGKPGGMPLLDYTIRLFRVQ